MRTRRSGTTALKSIIVIDEVQKVMPPRPSGSKPPQLVSELETHRHRGFDLFFMTQDPSLVDNHLKKLAGEHIHLVRQWGRQKADLFKMQKVQDPTNANLKRALHSTFPYRSRCSIGTSLPMLIRTRNRFRRSTTCSMRCRSCWWWRCSAACGSSGSSRILIRSRQRRLHLVRYLVNQVHLVHQLLRSVVR